MKWLLFTLLFLVFCVFGLSIWTRSRRKKINPKVAKRVIFDLQKMKGSPSEQVLKSHSLLIKTVKPLCPELKSAGEIMQKLNPRLKNQKAYWQFHALRNRVAHEPNAKVTPKQAAQAKQVFMRVIEDLAR
jgi:dipeptidase